MTIMGCSHNGHNNCENMDTTDDITGSNQNNNEDDDAEYDAAINSYRRLANLICDMPTTAEKIQAVLELGYENTLLMMRFMPPVEARMLLRALDQVVDKKRRRQQIVFRPSHQFVADFWTTPLTKFCRFQWDTLKPPDANLCK